MGVLDIETIDQWNEFISVQAGGGTKSPVFVVDFYADWCGPCKAVKPRYGALSEKYKGVPFLSVNIDNVGPVAERFNVTSMPTFVVIKDGQVTKTVVGADMVSLEIGIESALN